MRVGIAAERGEFGRGEVCYAEEVSGCEGGGGAGGVGAEGGGGCLEDSFRAGA